jgi:hypothetical protein
MRRLSARKVIAAGLLVSVLLLIWGQASPAMASVTDTPGLPTLSDVLGQAIALLQALLNTLGGVLGKG